MAAVTEGFDDRLREVELHTQRNADRISSHEDLCAIRYQGINDSLENLKSVLLRVGFLLLTGMAGVLVKLVFFP